jgi:glycosyltransferase involved in cell wall biosynthesis
MRAQFHFSIMGVVAPRQRMTGIRRALFRRSLRDRNLKAVLTIDPTLVEYAQQHDAGLARKLVYVADPSERYDLPQRGEARAQLGIPSEAAVVLVYGAVSKRKGVCTLLEAAAQKSCPNRIHVILAGKQDSEIATFLEGPVASAVAREGRLHVLNGYVPSALESTLLAAADCIWVAYSGFYTMSSALVFAGINGLPAITSEEGVIGYLGRQNGLGVEVKANSVPSALAALQRLSADPLLGSAGERGRVAFASHTAKIFQKTIAGTVGRCLSDTNTTD